MGVAEEAGEQLAKEVDHLGMTIEEALKRTTFTVQLAMGFDIGNEGETSTPPEPDEMIGRIDGMTWFWNKAGEAWLEEGRSTGLLDMTRSETEGVVTYAITSEGFTEPGKPAVIVVEAATRHDLAGQLGGIPCEGREPAARDWSMTRSSKRPGRACPGQATPWPMCLRGCFAAPSSPRLPLLGELAGASDEPGESTGPLDRLLATAGEAPRLLAIAALPSVPRMMKAACSRFPGSRFPGSIWTTSSSAICSMIPGRS